MDSKYSKIVCRRGVRGGRSAKSWHTKRYKGWSDVHGTGEVFFGETTDFDHDDMVVNLWNLIDQTSSWDLYFHSF